MQEKKKLDPDPEPESERVTEPEPIVKGEGTGKTEPVIAMVLGSTITSSSGTTTLYRAVSHAEFNQLMQTGKFSSGQNGLNAKFFAESYQDAVKWGNILNGQGHYKVIKVEVPNNVANDTNKFIRWERLDGIGPARAAECSDLNKLKLKVLEVNDRNDDDDLKPGGGSSSGGLGAGKTKTVSDGQGYNYIIDNAGNIRRDTSYPDSWMQPMWLQPPGFVKITNRHDYGDVFYNIHGYRRDSGQMGIPIVPIPGGGIPVPAPAPMPMPIPVFP